MLTQESLAQYNEKELLIQLRMAVAVLEERTTHVPAVASRLQTLENENRWIKRLVLTATPLGPLLAGVITFFKHGLGFN